MLATINSSRVSSGRARSLLAAAAVALGFAASTGMARTEPLAPIAGYAVRRGPKPPKRDAKRRQFTAGLKRVKRQARNLHLARCGAFGPCWQVV